MIAGRAAEVVCVNGVKLRGAEYIDENGIAVLTAFFLRRFFFAAFLAKATFIAPGVAKPGVKAWTSRMASAQHNKDLRRDPGIRVFSLGTSCRGRSSGDFSSGAMLNNNAMRSQKLTRALLSVNHFYKTDPN